MLIAQSTLIFPSLHDVHVSSNDSANEQDTALLKRCTVSACANAQHRWHSILYSKNLLTHMLVMNPVSSVTGWIAKQTVPYE